MKLPAAKIEGVGDPKSTRYTLNCVSYEPNHPEGPRCIATDGHILSIIAVESEPGDKPALIPLEAFAAARRLKPKGSAHVSLDTSQDGAVHVGVKSAVGADWDSTYPRQQFAITVGQFPNYAAVVPKIADGDKPIVSFNPHLLLRLVEGLAGKPDKYENLCVELYQRKGQPDCAIGIRIASFRDCSSDRTDALGVLMPMHNEGATWRPAKAKAVAQGEGEK